MPVTHPVVRATVVSHFNLGPVHHADFEMLALQLAQTLQVESSKTTSPGHTTLWVTWNHLWSDMKNVEKPLTKSWER